MTTQALLLNADYTPLRAIAWQRAVCLLLDKRAVRVEAYADRFVRSVELRLPWPAVLALTRYSRHRSGPRLSRANVLARDGYRCAYCGLAPLTRGGRPRLEDLTIDHVVPRAQSQGGRVRLPNGDWTGVTSWRNLVTACGPCNWRKGARTPAQAGLKLAQVPVAPTQWDAIRMALVREPMPDEWKAWVPREWRDYWDVELESG